MLIDSQVDKADSGNAGDGLTALQLVHRLKKVNLGKISRAAYYFAFYLIILTPVVISPRKRHLRRFIRARPELLLLGSTSYVAAGWDPPTRLARVIDHCETASTIGGAVDFLPDEIVYLIRPLSTAPQYRISLDQPRWLLRDGQLAISLWDGIDRIFSLQFCLSSQTGERLAYIGGLQGRVKKDGEINIMDRYRRFTKLAAGMRPRDFLVEVFAMFCKSLDVKRVLAVSDVNHPQRKISDIRLSYDKVWRERGGIYNGNGFFVLPVAGNRRSEEEIPARKRAMYRRRYELLRNVEAELCAVLRTGIREGTITT